MRRSDSKEERNTRVVKDALGISSGTIATLTGMKNYVDIDRIQSDFVLFVNNWEGSPLATWQDAWAVFSKGRNFREGSNSMNTIEVTEDFRIPGTNKIVEAGERIEIISEAKRFIPGRGTFAFNIDGTIWYQIEIDGYTAFVAKIDNTHFKMQLDVSNVGIEKALKGPGRPAVYHIGQFRGKPGYDDFEAWLDGEETIAGKILESVHTDMRHNSGVRWHQIERDGKVLFLRRVDDKHFAVSEKSDTRLDVGVVYSLDEVKQNRSFYSAVRLWLEGKDPIAGKVFDAEIIEERR